MKNVRERTLDSNLWRSNALGYCYLVDAGCLPEVIFSPTDVEITRDQWDIPRYKELPLRDEILLAIIKELVSFKIRYNVLWFAFQAVVTPVRDMTDGKLREDVYFCCNVAADKKSLYNPERSLSFYIHSERELIKLLRSDVEMTRYSSGDKKRSVLLDTDSEENALWAMLEPLTLTFAEVQRVYWEIKKTTRSKREDVLWLRIALACLDQRKAKREDKPSDLELDLMDLVSKTSKKNLQADPRFKQRLVSIEDFSSVSYDLRFAWDPGRHPRSPQYQPEPEKEKVA